MSAGLLPWVAAVLLLLWLAVWWFATEIGPLRLLGKEQKTPRERFRARLILTPIFGLITFFLSIFPWIALSNLIFDSSAPTFLTVRIDGKRIEKGKPNRYILQTRQEEQSANPLDIEAERTFYEARNPGDVIIVRMRRGALGGQWIESLAAKPVKTSSNRR